MVGGVSAAATGSMRRRGRRWPTASPGAPRFAPSPSREPPSRAPPPHTRFGLMKRVGRGWLAWGVGGRGNALGDEVAARLRAEWQKLGKWENGPNDIWPAGATGLDL